MLPIVSVYSYDASDNRIEFQVPDQGFTYTYEVDDADNLVATYRQEGVLPATLYESYTHDADGNMTSRTRAGETITYTWSEHDRLLRVSSNVNGRMQDNRYNVNGIRKRKLAKDGNSSTEYSAGISTVASKAATSGSSAPTISYIMGGQMILGAEVNGAFQFWLSDGSRAPEMSLTIPGP